ncbi:glycosyltransferase family 2 protein [Gloeocapsopsis crepidinum LEGE 06123]|uniref:Glycosyltransferase family 2 protein n=1 Tax=Gloeocapsopsis crepidinum LEGE 06123 TaxID=588587 RepID=A0ABR9UU03_9CHRO|nr:glycosyltransferase family 2 protein [Gloeocapsopsis crepidinum]MBE9191767.1 glycosyltransferase family 2 protein [Gloeocapsopsis crepidinum LEGE 06123]
MEQVRVSIIIVNYNAGEVLVNCLKSIQRYIQSIRYEIIIVDNCSTDGSVALVKQNFPQLTIHKQENTGFGAGSNAGANLAQGEFLLFLNPDTLIKDDILFPLVELLEKEPKFGVVGPKILNFDGTLQSSNHSVLSIWQEFLIKSKNNLDEENISTQSEVSFVTGAAFFIRKKIFKLVGGFDERFFMYFEDVDLCLRVKEQGWKIIYAPQVSLVHIRGYSSRNISDLMTVEYRRSQIYYYQKHRPLWEQILLRIYLTSKFLIRATIKKKYLKIILLILNFKKYPLKINCD